MATTRDYLQETGSANQFLDLHRRRRLYGSKQSGRSQDLGKYLKRDDPAFLEEMHAVALISRAHPRVDGRTVATILEFRRSKASMRALVPKAIDKLVRAFQGRVYRRVFGKGFVGRRDPGAALKSQGSVPGVFITFSSTMPFTW
jgi:hypothetical protein